MDICIIYCKTANIVIDIHLHVHVHVLKSMVVTL